MRRQLQRLRQSGKRIVMTNGCFDLLHPGHVASLEAARKQGDCLLVAVNSDRSVREIKGPGRPVIDEQGRTEMLAALACVDYVVVFDEASVAGLVDRVQPDVLVKADQYSTEQVVGHESVLRRGGDVVTVPTKHRYSTSDVIERIQGLSFAQTRGVKPNLNVVHGGGEKERERESGRWGDRPISPSPHLLPRRASSFRRRW